MISPSSASASRPSVRHVAVAALAPLLGAGVAYLLWWVSDRVVDIGPLDRASFGWLVVLPVWALTPFAVALAWRRIDAREAGWAAIVAGLVVGAAAAILFWLATAFPACDHGAVSTPMEALLPSTFVGLVVGVGLAASCVATAIVLRGGRTGAALAVAVGSAVALVILGAIIATPLAMSGGCLR